MFSIMVFTACVTVNIYFPAAEVKEAAEEIAKDVRGMESGQDSMDANPGNTRSFLNLISTAYAQQELSVSNATIRQIKARMKSRYNQLSPFFKQGVLGESGRGLLVIKNLSGINLKDKAQVKRLVDAENSDRMALYKAVSKALNISVSEIARVQEIFSEEWQKTAPKGTWIETRTGQWRQR
jgi:uncharacterized protein YdbL (DUF1318 family)